MTKTESATPSSFRWRFYLGYTLFLLVVLVTAGEIAVRVMGYSPWTQAKSSLDVSPGDSFFQPDSLLGYTGRPGTFDALLNGKLAFRVTHNAKGYRIVAPDQAQDLPDSAQATQQPEIWLLGCSFTHGYGVNDSATYPWRLQARFPGFKFRNFALSGYSTLQSRLQLTRLLKERKAPALVILAYGAFHDQRNTSNRYWRKALSGSEVTDGLRYPHLRYNANGKLEMGDSQLEYRPFPLMCWSALSHYLEMIYNNAEDTQLRSTDITRHLIQQIQEQSEAGGARFLLAGIFRHPETSKMLEHFAAQGMATLDISEDTEAPQLRILPEDGHPNALAHARMATTLGDFLQQNFISTGN